MGYYRFILQGDGARANGEWFGFYAARQSFAASVQDGEARVRRVIEDDWRSGPSAELGSLVALKVVCVWRPFLGEWRRLPNGGHTLFSDSIAAQRSAFRIEAGAAAAPSRLVRPVLAELSD